MNSCRELPAEERLVEDNIAEQYAVSRVPVREALRQLESEGFVTSERYPGGDGVLDIDPGHGRNDVGAPRPGGVAAYPPMGECARPCGHAVAA